MSPDDSKVGRPESRKAARRAPIGTSEGESPLLIMTIGHSTRPIEEFVRLIQAHGVTRVVDVRTIPRSRHNPQFDKASLSLSLEQAGLKYVHMPGLGGLRHAKSDSPNKGWQNASFRGYADYMQTPEFAKSLDALVRLAGRERIVLMCAEAVPWRCHRSLIADALLVRGVRTEDIMSATLLHVHALTPFADVRGTTITYPSETDEIEPKKLSVRQPLAKTTAKTTPGKRSNDEKRNTRS